MSSVAIPVDDPAGTAASFKVLEISLDCVMAGHIQQTWGEANGSVTRFWGINVWPHPVSRHVVDTAARHVGEFEAKMNALYDWAQQHKPYRESEVQPIGTLRLVLGQDTIPDWSQGERDEGREHGGASDGENA